MSDHFFGPYFLTSSTTKSSSSFVQGPLIRSGLSTFCHRCKHWMSDRSWKRQAYVANLNTRKIHNTPRWAVRFLQEPKPVSVKNRCLLASLSARFCLQQLKTENCLLVRISNSYSAGNRLARRYEQSYASTAVAWENLLKRVLKWNYLKERRDLLEILQPVLINQTLQLVVFLLCPTRFRYPFWLASHNTCMTSATDVSRNDTVRLQSLQHVQKSIVWRSATTGLGQQPFAWKGRNIWQKLPWLLVKMCGVLTS